MANSVIGIYNSTDYEEYMPKVYHNNQWYGIKLYAYVNGEWVPVGQAGTLMIPLYTKNGEPFYTSDSKLFQVRKHE